jgi:hypothetical protein
MSSSLILRRKSRPQKKNQNIRFGSTIPNRLYSDTFPREMKVMLKYNAVHTLTPSAGLASDYVYNLNSIFDPDVTGVGHQPRGRDNWAVFYNRYRVDSCKVTMYCTRSSGGTVTILGNNQSTSITDVAEPLETPIGITGAHSPNGSSLKLVKTFNLADLNGVTRSVYETDDRYQALMSASPSEVLCLHMVWIDTALSTGSAFVSIELDYFVTLFDPIQQAQS